MFLHLRIVFVSPSVPNMYSLDTVISFWHFKTVVPLSLPVSDEHATAFEIMVLYIFYFLKTLFNRE